MYANRHEGRWYAIYSPSRDAWRDEDGGWGPLGKAEVFNQPNSPGTACLFDGDARWVGPISEAEREGDA
jgi:hypothetical protein